MIKDKVKLKVYFEGACSKTVYASHSRLLLTKDIFSTRFDTYITFLESVLFMFRNNLENVKRRVSKDNADIYLTNCEGRVLSSL